VFLRAVKLRGFKSFPDPVEVRLEPGVAVVVGPNGSGKSNLADAVRWAAGSLSTLDLRAEKPEDVLFSGGKGRTGADACSVELVFDNAGGDGPLPFEEVSVARRLTRGGEGRYLVNGATVRRTDLVELLADLGIGGEMHSVIGQGRVEQILASRPEDRRALVEEAAGLGRFKRRRHRAELKLARVAEQVERARDLEAEVRKRIRPLALQATAAERARKLTVEIAGLEARLAAADLDRVETELAEVGERRAAADADRRRRDDRLAGLLEERREAEEELGEAGARHERATAALYRLRSAIERAELRRERAVETAQALRAELASPRLPLPEAPPSYEQVVRAARGWEAERVADARAGAELVEAARAGERDAVLVASGGETWFASGAGTKRKPAPGRPISLEALAEAVERVAAALERAQESARRFEPALAARVDAGGSRSGELGERLRDLGAREAELRREAAEASERLTAVQIEAARLERERDELRARLPEEATAEPLAEEEAEALRAQVSRLAARREALGQVNPLAAEEHARETARLRELAGEREDLERSLSELERLRTELTDTVERRFAETYAAVERHFAEVVATLFPGGTGRLVPTEPEEGEDPGVEIELQPAGKRVTRLSLLSGGEKALGAISFLFALFLARPCPFYLLDEVEAALDDTNIGRFVELLRRFSDRAQFVVVTHQKRTMEAADVLYGVTMGDDGVSQVVSKRLSAAQPRPVAEAAA
jgi:chromosome segregation ATPase